MAEAEKFASVPQPVPTRQKYREDEPTGRQSHNNIMNDRRVVRGNTYASLVGPEEDPMEVKKKRDAQKQRLYRANQRKDRPGTPDAVYGRKHMDIQTDTYLEELTERTIAFDAETMTDFLLDRPPPPLFLPAKTGADVETQIEEGELFDFDREVEAVLDILVGKTLETSMMEILEEEEIAAMRRHQEEYERIRTQELLEVNRIEAQEQRRADECTRRKIQAKNREELEKHLSNKIAARSVALETLRTLKRTVMETLVDNGTIAAEKPTDIESVFLPWLLTQVQSRLDIRDRNRQLYDDLAVQAIESSTKQRSITLEQGRAAQIEVDAEERRVMLENEERLRLKRLEEERIKNEQEGVLEQENEPYIIELEVAECTEEGLKLSDESTAEIADDIKSELTTKFQEKAEADKMTVTVNKSANLVTAFELIIAPVEEPPEAEEAPAEEAPAEEAPAAEE